MQSSARETPSTSHHDRSAILRSKRVSKRRRALAPIRGTHAEYDDINTNSV
jgi:hypothetical protein